MTKQNSKTKKENKLKIIKETAGKLLEFLKVEAKIEVSEDKENEVVRVQIATEKSGILIGNHGEVLNALQLILGLIVNRKLEKWERIIVNVGDYREQREEELRNLALNTAQKVKFSGQPAVLPNLSSFERRLIHLFLADRSEVITESEGEGETRRLVVKPKLEIGT